MYSSPQPAYEQFKSSRLDNSSSRSRSILFLFCFVRHSCVPFWDCKLFPGPLRREFVRLFISHRFVPYSSSLFSILYSKAAFKYRSLARSSPRPLTPPPHHQPPRHTHAKERDPHHLSHFSLVGALVLSGYFYLFIYLYTKDGRAGWGYWFPYVRLEEKGKNRCPELSWRALNEMMLRRVPAVATSSSSFFLVFPFGLFQFFFLWEFHF